MSQRGRNCFLLALTLTAVLALAWAPPAQAAGWTDWRDQGRELAAGLVARVLDRLGLAPHSSSIMVKCGDSDHGSSIDPNGCPKASVAPVLKCGDQGSVIDPNGCPKTNGGGSFWTPGRSAAERGQDEILHPPGRL